MNRNYLVVAIVAIVNALGYGIIIPILYRYTQQFGLSDFHNGLLFAVFSVCQFISTPIIGRLSDKYGRKPLLIISITGTAISFLMMAIAHNPLMLFLARALDGITAGNIPVALAVISDTTAPKDRAKGFGIIGASFGFGFVFGPAISAFTVGLGQTVPFYIATVIATIAVILTMIFLQETNQHIGQISKEKLFNFHKLISTLTEKHIGILMLVTLIYSSAFSLFIYAFQPFSTKILQLNESQNATMFTVFGIVGLIGQAWLVGKITKRFGLKTTLIGSLAIVAAAFICLFYVRSLEMFIIISSILGLANAMIPTSNQTMISHITDAKSQGSIQGVNASYMSIGQIIGPIAGGAIATFGVPYPFLAGGLVMVLAIIIARNIQLPRHKETAF